MSENKELNKEQLEKVSGGGGMYDSAESINWIFTKDAQVYVQLSDGTKAEGKVDKKGYIIAPYGLGGYIDCYHIDSTTNSSVSKWYPGSMFNGNTVSVNDYLLGEPSVVVAW